ncbi:hypothetical protein Ae201684P_017725 [Aphanomyces euteiches]|nr:hypothetical protein Ae201684P_017725 [Aphanomyces euteiches]
MDFLFRAGVMVDTSRRELNLPEGEYVELHDQPVRYSRGNMNYVRLNRDVSIPPGGSVVVPLPKLREGMPETLEYWVHRDVRWITTALNSENKPAAYKVTNVSERNVLDEVAAESADDGSWKEPRPPSPRHLLTADGELRETCEVDDESSEGGRQPFADQTAVEPGMPPSLTEAAKSKTPAVFCYHACHFRDTLPPPSILLMDTVPDNLDQRRMAKEVVLREGIDLSTEELEQQLAIIPEVPREVEPFDPDQLDVGEDELSDDEKEKMRVVLRKYRKFFIKSGNGLPPPAKGAVCDIDFGEAKPLAERARRIRPELLKKLFDLLRGLLDFGLITFSNSPWASPIVLVLKKGGKDIRLCIDYRGINELQELMRSPIPTLDGMLANFHAMQWFLSLDNASGFWVVRATKRARKVSAFICALGHFEWTRMAQGLKNAPMIYQRMITNALFGFVDMPPGVADEDADGEPVDMFALGFKCDLSQLPPPANRTSFADDISDGADSWDGIVELTDRILARLTYFGVSISALKSKFGKIATDFLGHVVSRRGLEARPRSLDAVLAAPFPKCLRDMQSFLGWLNFYSRFIENYSILVSCLYEISDEELRLGLVSPAAVRAFANLKAAYSSTPLLRHADPEREFHGLLYTTTWAISATVCEDYDGVLHPVRFCGRTLKGGEPRYEEWAKEALALLRAVKVCYYELRNMQLVVYSRHGLLKWILADKHGKADHLPWAAILSPWTIRVEQVVELDERWVQPIRLVDILHPPDASTLADMDVYRPNKAKDIQVSQRQATLPQFAPDERATVVAFDGAIKAKEKVGSYGFVIWQLPGWSVLWVENGVLADATVNLAEYNGLIAALERVLSLSVVNPVIFGDSRLVIHQVLGWMQSKQSHLQHCLDRVRALRDQATGVEFHHVKRELNGAADLLAGLALQDRTGGQVLDESILEELRRRNLLPELLQPATTAVAPMIMAFQAKSTEKMAALRLDRVSKAQDRERELANIKCYLRSEVSHLTEAECRVLPKLAGQFEIGERGALYRVEWSSKRSPEERMQWKLVIPRVLVKVVLVHCHDDAQGGHAKFQRTYERARAHFYWRLMYADTKDYVADCAVCNTAGPPPNFRALSPGNLMPEGPLDVVCMDAATDMPLSFRGNTQLIVFADVFTGLIMTKATPNRTAHTVALAFEEVVFRRFGACRELRHDRDPSFMSNVFKYFCEMLGQRQMPTFAYRPQANGLAERSIQVMIRAVKHYVQDPKQKDWDDWAERLVFAMNTSVSVVRKETPSFLMHGWDPHTTITASLPTIRRDAEPEAYRWRLQVHQQQVYCHALNRDLVAAAIANRSRRHNAQLPEDVDERIKVGDAVWLYIDQVKPGVKVKLAHRWHGPFRVLSRPNDYSSELESRVRHTGKVYRFHAIVHDSRLKPRRIYLERPVEVLLNVPEMDFDEELALPDDSFLGGRPDRDDVLGSRPQVVAVRNVRYTEDIKEYEVQFRQGGPWIWEALVSISPTEFIYEFERVRLGFDRLAMMVQEELHPIE